MIKGIFKIYHQATTLLLHLSNCLSPFLLSMVTLLICV